MRCAQRRFMAPLLLSNSFDLQVVHWSELGARGIPRESCLAGSGWRWSGLAKCTRAGILRAICIGVFGWLVGRRSLLSMACALLKQGDQLDQQSHFLWTHNSISPRCEAVCNQPRTMPARPPVNYVMPPNNSAVSCAKLRKSRSGTCGTPLRILSPIWRATCVLIHRSRC